MKKLLALIALTLTMTTASATNQWVCTEDPNINPASCTTELNFCGNNGNGAPGKIIGFNSNGYQNQIPNPYENIFHAQGVLPQGTNAGTATAGVWHTRILNTEVTNDFGVTLSNSEFTLPAGTYWIEFGAPATFVNGYRTRLYDVGNSREVMISKSTRNYFVGDYNHTSNTLTNVHASAKGRLTLTESTTFRLETRVEVSRGGDGLGSGGNISNEIYAEVLVMKIK